MRELEEEKALLEEQLESFREGLREVEQHREGADYEVDEELRMAFDKLG